MDTDRNFYPPGLKTRIHILHLKMIRFGPPDLDCVISLICEHTWIYKTNY